MTSVGIPKTPPKELVDAIAQLKKHDVDFLLNTPWKIQSKEIDKELNIEWNLSKKLGLDRYYVRQMIHKQTSIQMPCNDCKQNQVDVNLQLNTPHGLRGKKEVICDLPLCPECKERHEYDKWKEGTEKQKEEESKKQIMQYCYKIRGELPEYEETYQQYLEDEAASKEMVGLSTREITDPIENPPESPESVFKRTGKYPDGSKTKTQWLRHLKNERRLAKQRIKELQSDWKLRMNTPSHILQNTIWKDIGCRCYGEDIRQGIFCETCKLLVLVHKYMMNLFEEATKKIGR